MGAFKDMRDTLAADLAPMGVPVFATWPTALDVPCVFLSPPLGGDYVTGGPTFGGTYTLAIDVVILVAHAPAELGIEALEDLIEIALRNTVDWALSGVDSPSPVNVTDSGAEYLGTVIHLTKPARLEE